MIKAYNFIYENLEFTFEQLEDGNYYTGEYAFYSCDNLEKVVIPNSVNTIKWYAFSDCMNLVNIVIPNSVTSLGNSAFKGCSSLKMLHFQRI